jgi:hypothetical protein
LKIQKITQRNQLLNIQHILNKHCSLLGHGAMYLGRCVPVFWRNMLPSFSGWKSRLTMEESGSEAGKEDLDWGYKKTSMRW